MLNIDPNIKIYIATGHTDMRKGAHQLSMVAGSLISKQIECGALFVFRGRSADRIKILWWDGQGFCLYYKCLDRGKFPWPKTVEEKSICITKAQLAMLIEGIAVHCESLLSNDELCRTWWFGPPRTVSMNSSQRALRC